MPALALDDGFTLTDVLEPVAGSPLTVTYRPALWPAVTAWQRAGGTAGEEDATAKLVTDHLVAWDATVEGKPVAVADKFVRKLPLAYLNALVAKIVTWAPKQQAKAEGN